MGLNIPLMIVALGVVFLWLVALTVLLVRALIGFKGFSQGAKKKDMVSVLNKMSQDLTRGTEKVGILGKDLEKLTKANLSNIQKIGLVRFNPFAGTGGNQSFCLSLLDGEGSGLVISSLHSRENTRIYAKPVKKGKAAGYELSKEEEEAIKNARRTN